MSSLLQKFESLNFRKLSLLSALCIGLSVFTSMLYQGVYEQYLLFSYILLLSAALLNFCTSKTNHFSFDYSPFIVLLSVFWIWAFITCFSSISFYDSYIQFWVLSIFPLSFFLVALKPDKKYMLLLGIAVTIAVSLIAFWALIQIFYDPDAYKFRAKGPFFNPNLLAGIINLVLMPYIALFVTINSSNKALTWGCYAVLILFMSAMLSTMSRGGVIGGSIGMLLLFAVLYKQQNFQKIRALMVSISAVTLYYFFHIFYFSFQTNNFASIENSLKTRFLIWVQSIEIFTLKPLLGFGLANFQHIYPQYRVELDQSRGIFVHMDPLQFAVEMGFIAPIMFYALLIAGLVRTTKTLKAPEQPLAYRYALTAGIFCGIVSLICHTHITFHLYSLPNLFILGIATGIWYWLSSEQSKNKIAFELTKQRKILLCAIFTFFSLIALHGASMMSVTGYFYAQAEKSWKEEGDTSKYLQNINLASVYTLGSDMEAYMQIARMQTALIKQPDISREDKEKLIQSNLGLFDKAEALNPYNPLVYYNRGVFYETLADHNFHQYRDEAEKQWQKSLHFNPRYTPAQKKLTLAK